MGDKIKKEKIFINAMDSWFSNFFIEAFRTDHMPDSKVQVEFMGTINDKKAFHLPMYFEPKIISFDFNTSYKTDIFLNDIILYNLNTGCIKELDYIINGLKALKIDSEKILIIISNILTWGKTPDKIQTDNPDEIIFIHPNDIKPEKPKLELNIEEEKENNENHENENNTKSMINEQNKTNKTNEEIKENKIENKENDTNASKGEQKTPDISKKISKKIEEEKKEEENKPKIVYYTEKDYLKRKPTHKYFEFKYIENQALLLNQKNNVKVYVICPGIIYGYGEKTFYSIFRSAILNLPIEEILLDKGRNIIPTIHMRDLINLISKIIEKKPNSYYILAFDQTKNRSLKSIIKSIYDCIGDSSKMIQIKEEELPEENNENKEGEIKQENEEHKDNNSGNNVENNGEGNNDDENNENNEKKMEEQIQEKKRNPIFTDKKYSLSKLFPRELLSIDLKLLPSEFLKGEIKKSFYNESDDENELKDNKNAEYIPLFKWHALEGIYSNLQSIRKEFIKYRNLSSNKVLILGNPYTGKTELSTILSKVFHLPIINSKNIVEFGKKLANIGVGNDNNNQDANETDLEVKARRNSIEKDLIHDIQKTIKELEEGKAIAEENYNKRKDKKKTDPPFDDNMYFRFNDEMMVRMLKRRLQENDVSVYGYILDGFPKNHLQAKELFEDIDKDKGGVPNSIIIFDNVEDDYLINRLKNSENFPKDQKDPAAVGIIDRANRRLGKIKENKGQEDYVDLVDFFKDEKFENLNILVLDTKKEIIEIVKEAQTFIMNNNENKINKVDEMLNCTEYQYDYVKEQEMKKQKEEEEELQKQNKQNEEKEEKNKKLLSKKNVNVNEEVNEEKSEEKKDEKNEEEKEEAKEKEEIKENEKIEESKKEEEIEEEKKEPEIPKTKYEIERENEFKLLEKKSEVLRRYLSENVLPLLSLGILHVATERPEDPVEALADFLLKKTIEIEKEAEQKKKEKEKKEREEINKDKKDENKKNNKILDNKILDDKILEKNNNKIVEKNGNENKNIEKKFTPMDLDFNIEEAEAF